MTSQQQADTLLSVWQRARQAGIPPADRIPKNDNVSEAEWESNLAPIRACIALAKVGRT